MCLNKQTIQKQLYSFQIYVLDLNISHLSSSQKGEFSKTPVIFPFFTNIYDLTIHQNLFYYFTLMWINFINNTALVFPNNNNTFLGFA